MPRLTSGDFDTEDQRFSRASGRKNFLAVIQKQHSQVLTDLAGEPFTEYCQWKRDTKSVKQSLWDALQPVLESKELPADLIRALSAWSEKYSLCADWVLDAALQAMRCWLKHSDTETGIGKEWGNEVLEAVIPGPQEKYSVFRFEAPTYYQPLIHEFQRERKKIETRVKAEFKAAFTAHLDRMEAEVKKMKAHPGKYGLAKPETKDNVRDFEWLVKFQVGKLEYEEIVTEHHDQGEHVEQDSVERAIRRTARLIGLRLRRSKRTQEKVKE